MSGGSYIIQRIREQAASSPSKTVFAEHKKDGIREISFHRYNEESDRLAAAVRRMGITTGDIVASYMPNGYDLNLLDLALMKAGAVHAALFPNYGRNELAQVLPYCRPQLVVCGPGMFISNAVKVTQELAGGWMLACMGASAQQVPDLVSLLQNETTPGSTEPGLSDYYAVYLTSGTTGNVKGALVTHAAISETVREMRNVFPLTEGSTSLSMAPFSVSSERCLNYYYQCSGVAVHYPASMESLIQTIASARPSIFLTSPLFLEKVKKNVMDKRNLQSRSVKDRILNGAIAFALLNSRIRPYGKITSFRHFLYDRIVYKKIRGVLGGNVRYIMSGGASSNPETLRFFWNMGIPVYEGYGMTECHIIAVNKPGDENTLSGVGRPFGKTEIRVSDNGEIQCRSPYMFSQYLSLEEITRQSFTTDGYFRTGDIGTIDGRGFISVTGRIKTLFKSMSGIYINPESIEYFLMRSPAVAQAVVIGENRPYLSAIILPSPEMGTAEVLDAVETQVKLFNSTRVEAEQIREYAITEAPFSVESGEMTSNQKLRRDVILKSRAELINSLYENNS